MVAYLLAELEVRDRARLLTSARAVQPVMARYGGAIVARSDLGSATIEGGRHPSLLVIHRWPDRAAFTAFYVSDDDAPLKRLRQAATASRITILGGADLPAGIVSTLQGLDATALAPDVRVASPARTYTGAGDVLHVLGLIAQVLDRVTVVDTLSEGRHQVTTIRARIDDDAVSGVVDEQFDPTGREVVDATLLLRPVDAVRAGMRRMAGLLATYPLPSAAGASKR